MRNLILILAVLALIGLAGCGRQTPEEATAAFCASLQAFGESLDQLDQVTPDTTVGDLEQAREQVARARQQVAQAAEDLAEARVDSIEAAWQDLERTVDSISNRDTLAEAAASVAASAAAVRAAIGEVGSATCPDWAGIAPPARAMVEAAVTPVLPSAASEEGAAPALPGAAFAAGPVAGIYIGTVPPSNGSELAVTLALHPNSDASMVFSSRPAGSDAAFDQQILEGTWTENADGTVSVTIDRLADGTQLAIAETLTLVQQDGQLVAVEFSQELFGPFGLTLQRSVEAAAGLSPGVVMTGTLPAATAVPVSAAEAPPGDVAATGLTGTTWQLLQMEQGSASTTVVPDPSLYTLTLSDDGSVVAAADCNRGSGAYQVDGANLTLQIGWDAAGCPQTSLARQFSTYLDYANAFLLQDGALLIYYNNSAGVMTFAAALP
jgi:heat shock protein HslJ